MSYKLESSKLGKTDVHEFYFRIYLQLDLFSKRGKRELRKNLNDFLPTCIPFKYGAFRALIDLRTVPSKYGTFKAYHLMKSTSARYNMHAKKIFALVTLIQYDLNFERTVLPSLLDASIGFLIRP